MQFYFFFLGPFNQSLYRSLGVSDEKPFFVVKESVVYALFDVPHLLKSVRNNLKKYDLKFVDKDSKDKEMRASWKDIETFYDKDSKQRYRIAPKLTYNHVYAKGLATMKVKLAAQTFSHSVAAGLNVYVTTHILGSSAAGTSEFVGTMNNLFDSMNSKSRKANGFASAVTKDSAHVDFWKKLINWIASWKFVTPDKKIIKPACQKGWMLTLNGTIGIWEKINEDVSYLLTNRLNQDCLENTFSSVRRKGGFRDNPSCYEFRSSVRNVMVFSFIKKSNSNCEDDSAANLLEMTNITDRSILSTVCETEWSEDDDETSPLVIDEVPTLPTTTNMENNVIAYVAGFFARKYLKQHPCNECEKLLTGPKILDAHTLMLYFKEFDIDSSYGMKWPSDEFYKTMIEMSEVFFANINHYFNRPNIRKNICSTMKIVQFEFFNDHSHKDEAKKFILFWFVTMMIKHKIRTKNGEISTNQILKKKLKNVKHM